MLISEGGYGALMNVYAAEYSCGDAQGRDSEGCVSHVVISPGSARFTKLRASCACRLWCARIDCQGGGDTGCIISRSNGGHTRIGPTYRVKLAEVAESAQSWCVSST